MGLSSSPKSLFQVLACVVVVMQNEMFLVLSLSLNFSRKLVLSL